MPEEIVPFNFEGSEVRTAGTADAPLFVAADICRVLEISKHRDAVSRLDGDERESVVVDTPGGKQEMACVTESGLYALVFRSRKPQAKRFRKWVTSEVLPSIRKTGQYSVNSRPESTVQPLPESRKEKLDITRDCIELLEQLGGMDERTRLSLKDVVRDIALGDQLALPSGDRTAWPISDRVRHLGHGVAQRSQLIRIGKIASDLFLERHGQRPVKREQFVDGAVRRVCEYKAADVDLLDKAIAAVMGPTDISAA